jgi:hypothetical protein
MKKLKNTIKLISIFVLILISNKLFAQTNTSPTQIVCAGSQNEPYLMNPITTGSTYQWSLSGGGALNNGTASDNILVDWGFSTGTYTITVIETDINGCQGAPVTVDVTVISSTISTSNVTECIIYSWNGQTYNSSGVYNFVTTNAGGCDSTATLNLTINQPTASTSNVTECITYSWNGQTYTSSGVYNFVTTNAGGCDSTATLNLTINPSTVSSTDVTECDTYTWNGQTYSSSGVYTFSTTNSNGCDSTATLNLTINPSTTSTSAATSCDDYNWNGQTYSSSGVYTFASTNSNGCDSIATLNLTINPSTTSSNVVTECDTYTWNGQTYSSSGVYTFATTNSNGCDSIATLNLTINLFTSTPLASNQTACVGTAIPDLIATGIGSTFTWYSDISLITPVANNSPFSTGQTAAGTYTYYVTDSLNGCESPATSVTLIIYASPITGPINHW